MSYMGCPACNQSIVQLYAVDGNGSLAVDPTLVYPQSTGRPPAPTEVPPELAEDYHEACAILGTSPKASAALSRRCLQATLADQGFNQFKLEKAIEAAVTSGRLASAVASELDAVRLIGNYAVHPLKDTSTGLVLPVEPDEAQWNIDLLDQLFDEFYVKPRKAEDRVRALNEKLRSAGRPEIPVFNLNKSNPDA